jgi:hypothetical protein
MEQNNTNQEKKKGFFDSYPKVIALTLCLGLGAYAVDKCLKKADDLSAKTQKPQITFPIKSYTYNGGLALRKPSYDIEQNVTLSKNKDCLTLQDGDGLTKLVWTIERKNSSRNFGNDYSVVSKDSTIANDISFTIPLLKHETGDYRIKVMSFDKKGNAYSTKTHF